MTRLEAWELCRSVRESGGHVVGRPTHKAGTDTAVIYGDYNEIIVVDGSDTVIEWISNFRCRLNNKKIHVGFYHAAEKFFDQFKSMIEEDKQYFFVGHSRGGAIAQILSLMFAERGAFCNVITFGSPKVGGKEFRDRMSENIVLHLRFVMRGDPVPNQPFWLKHYDTDYVLLENSEKNGIRTHLSYGKYLGGDLC